MSIFSVISSTLLRTGTFGFLRTGTFVFGLVLGTGTLGFASIAQAHFQLVYTLTSIIERPSDVPAKLIFWHPMSNDYAMAMDKPLKVTLFHRGKPIDLTPKLTPSQFHGRYNSVASWDVNIPVKRAGDYVVAVTPAPYFETSEDSYIQQITKTYLNRKQIPTDWQKAQGLVAEILPLVKPYNIPVGSSFTGIVKSAGQAVPFAEIEIEYMVAVPDIKSGKVSADASLELPGGSMTIYANSTGEFTMTLPKAGYWGFAALGVGPDTEYQGKPLSQDAVIWVQVHDLH